MENLRIIILKKNHLYKLYDSYKTALRLQNNQTYV